MSTESEVKSDFVNYVGAYLDGKNQTIPVMCSPLTFRYDDDFKFTSWNYGGVIQPSMDDLMLLTPTQARKAMIKRKLLSLINYQVMKYCLSGTRTDNDVVDFIYTNYNNYINPFSSM